MHSISRKIKFRLIGICINKEVLLGLCSISREIKFRLIGICINIAIGFWQAGR